MLHGKILGAAFSVVFRGLLLIHGDTENAKQQVITVDAPGHTSRLVIAGQSQTLLRGDSVTFSLPAGAATTDTTYDSRVPNLRDFIVEGQLPSDVATASPQNGGRVVVTLPRGILSAEGNFATPAKFTRSDGTTDVRCMAEAVRLSAETSSAVTITINGPERTAPATLTVPANGTVTIINGPQPQPTGLHFHEYARLLQGNGRVGDVSLVLNERCGEQGQRLTATKQEIAKHAKDRQKVNVLGLPDGDCGPVDNP